MSSSSSLALAPMNFGFGFAPAGENTYNLTVRDFNVPHGDAPLGDVYRNKPPIRRLLVVCGSVAALILFLFLILFLVYNPRKPRFTIQDATVYSFSTNSSFLSSNIQVTIESRNPNKDIGIYYDKIDAWAQYHDQQITQKTSLPPSYQGHYDDVVWSPLVYGDNVPVSPFVKGSWTQDQMAGVVWVRFVITGKIRWKGTIFGKKHIRATCPALISFPGRNAPLQSGLNGMAVGSGFKYQIKKECDVDIN